MFQAFITAIGSSDRLITTLKPHDYYFKNKFKFKIAIMVLSVILAFLLHIPSYLYYDAVTVQNATTCSYINKFGSIYFKIEYLIFRIAVPFLVMIVSSIIITSKVCEIKSRISNSSNRQK